ncbi:hypothetical protein BC835DRAFT_62599 [Cytidiella melzeri]|nr:hypothetical protein BC835DRAFT_62599 [Cytidiella melzeri]
MNVRKLGLRRSGSLQNFTCGGLTGPFTLPYPIFGALALAVIVSSQPPSPLSLPAAHQRRRPPRSALLSPRLSECGHRPQATPHSPVQVCPTCQIHPRQPHTSSSLLRSIFTLSSFGTGPYRCLENSVLYGRHIGRRSKLRTCSVAIGSSLWYHTFSGLLHEPHRRGAREDLPREQLKPCGPDSARVLHAHRPDPRCTCNAEPGHLRGQPGHPNICIFQSQQLYSYHSSRCPGRRGCLPTIRGYL